MRNRISGYNMEYLEGFKAEVETYDYFDKQTTTKKYENLKFSDKHETIIKFQVPPNVQKIKVSL